MKAILLAIGAGVCWGIGEVATRSVLHTGKVGPITAITIRSTVALPILWIAYAITMQVLKAEPRDWTQAGLPTLSKLVLGSGVVAGAAAMILFYSALNLGEVSRIKPIAFAVAPAVGALLGWLVLKEDMTPRKALGVLTILAGVVILTGKSAPPSTTPATPPASTSPHPS